MLPFDNKNEFQLVVDMPENHRNHRRDSRPEAYLSTVPEVTDFTAAAGAARPWTSTGSCATTTSGRGRTADIRVNLPTATSAKWTAIPSRCASVLT